MPALLKLIKGLAKSSQIHTCVRRATRLAITPAALYSLVPRYGTARTRSIGIGPPAPGVNHRCAHPIRTEKPRCLKEPRLCAALIRRHQRAMSAAPTDNLTDWTYCSLSYVSSSDVVTLLAPVWVSVAPIPVPGLLPPVRPREFVMIPVVVRKIHSPSMVFAVIPVMVVPVAPIVDSDLYACALGPGNSHN